MKTLTNLEKIRLAKSHPVAYAIGIVIGSIIPIVTMGAKIAGMRVNEYYYLLAIAGGLFSILSLWSFGLGAFGTTDAGRWKTGAFCALIEISWLALPYHILPNAEIPIHGNMVTEDLQWTFFTIALLGFLVAIAVNAVEVAATMANYHEEAKLKENTQVIPTTTMEYTLQLQRYDTMLSFVGKIHAERRCPRMKRVDNHIVVIDEKTDESIILYPQPEHISKSTESEPALS